MFCRSISILTDYKFTGWQRAQPHCRLLMGLILDGILVWSIIWRFVARRRGTFARQLFP